MQHASRKNCLQSCGCLGEARQDERPEGVLRALIVTPRRDTCRAEATPDAWPAGHG